jgi:hypothetical protein
VDGPQLGERAFLGSGEEFQDILLALRTPDPLFQAFVGPRHIVERVGG